MIPRITPEDKRRVEEMRFHKNLLRVPKNKRWMISLFLNYLLALQKIEDFFEWIEMKRYVFFARVRFRLYKAA